MDHTNCHVERIEKPFEGEIPEGIARTELLVSGMGCQNCAARVHNALIQLEGVFRADVDLPRGIARVFYDQNIVDADELVRAVMQMGILSNHRYMARVAA
jgi:copper chaperone